MPVMKLNVNVKLRCVPNSHIYKLIYYKRACITYYYFLQNELSVSRLESYTNICFEYFIHSHMLFAHILITYYYFYYWLSSYERLFDIEFHSFSFQVWNHWSIQVASSLKLLSKIALKIELMMFWSRNWTGCVWYVIRVWDRFTWQCQCNASAGSHS